MKHLSHRLNYAQANGFNDSINKAEEAKRLRDHGTVADPQGHITAL